jgi:hypothetical protein
MCSYVQPMDHFDRFRFDEVRRALALPTGSVREMAGRTNKYPRRHGHANTRVMVAASSPLGEFLGGGNSDMEFNVHVTSRAISVVSLALVFFLGVGGHTTASASSNPMFKARFSTCHKLNRTFHHGVMTNHYNRREWTALGATGRPAYRPRLYARVEERLDSDNDGIACER